MQLWRLFLIDFDELTKVFLKFFNKKKPPPFAGDGIISLVKRIL